MIDDTFLSWMESEKGLLSIDPWNLFNLSKTIVFGEPISFGEKLERCINLLLESGYRPIVVENGEFYWTDGFFEKAEGKSLYDEIKVVQSAYGRNSTQRFWLGTKFPTS